MIVETGHYALVLALALALVQAVVPFWGAGAAMRALMAIAPPDRAHAIPAGRARPMRR